MIARLKAALEGAQSVALVCHLSPDMDTLGSAVALRYILEAQGKRAVVYDQDEVPERYLFLEGLDAVRARLDGRLSVFCGNSGVGKSTLLSALLPGHELETGEISQKLGRGRHTTREVVLYESCGGLVADTPGFASLEANRAGFIPKENLEHAFPEFGPYLGQCQFTGCSHRTEKGCAVRQALAEGKLSQTRYDSYCAMYDEVKDVKDWQRPKF